MNKKYQYDVALSFAGENREYVEQVYTYLTAQGLKPFYDRTEEVELWGKDLAARFDDIYQNKARYCVMFISKYYLQKVWPKHERRSALARAITDEGYLLPTRFDDTNIPGLPPTIHYIDLRQKKPEQLGKMITRKLRKTRRIQIQDATSLKQSFRRPKVNQSFNPYQESQDWVKYLNGEISKCSKEAGIDFSSFEKSDKHCLRFVVNGKPVYSINIEIGGFYRDHGLSFSYAHGEMHALSSGYNAYGDFEWDKEKESVILKLNVFNMFGPISTSDSGQNLTQQELVEYIWNKVCDAVEEEY